MLTRIHNVQLDRDRNKPPRQLGSDLPATNLRFHRAPETSQNIDAPTKSFFVNAKTSLIFSVQYKCKEVCLIQNYAKIQAVLRQTALKRR